MRSVRLFYILFKLTINMSYRPIAPVQSVEPTRLKFTAMWNEFRFLSFSGKQHKSSSVFCEWGHLISSQTQIYPPPRSQPHLYNKQSRNLYGTCLTSAVRHCVSFMKVTAAYSQLGVLESWLFFGVLFIFLFHYPALVSQIPKITCNMCCVGIFVYTVEYSLVVWSQIIKIVL